MVFGHLGTIRSNWVSSAHLVKGSLSSLVLYLSAVLLLQSSFHSSSYGEDMEIYFQLLGYQKHLNIHLQPILEPTGLLLFIIYHI